MCSIHLITEDHAPLKLLLPFITGAELRDSDTWGRGSSKRTKMSNGPFLTMKDV